MVLRHFYLQLTHSPGGENLFNSEFIYILEFDSTMSCQSIRIVMANNSTHSNGIYRPIDMHHSSPGFKNKFRLSR